MKNTTTPAPAIDGKTVSKVLQADLANLLKRVQAGVPLTTAQRRLVSDACGTSTEATDPEKAIVNLRQLSTITGLSGKWLRALAKSGTLTPPGPDGYPLALAVSALVKHYQQAVKASAPTSDKALKLRREVELLDMKLAQQRQEWIRAADIQAYMGDIFHCMKQGILASHLTRPEQGELLDGLRRLGMKVPVRDGVGTDHETSTLIDDDDDKN